MMPDANHPLSAQAKPANEHDLATSDQCASSTVIVLEQSASQGKRILEIIMSSHSRLGPIKAIVVLLHRMVELSLSISLLLMQRLTDSASILLRALLETHLYLSFLLQDDKLHTSRCEAFLAAYYMEKYEELCQLDAATESGKKLRDLQAQDRYLSGATGRTFDTSSARATLEKFLSQPHCVRYTRKAQHQDNWLKHCGVENLRTLAKQLRLEGTYVTIYKPLSRKIHLYDAVDCAIDNFGEDNRLKDITGDLTSTIALATLAVALTLESYRGALAVCVPRNHAYRLDFVLWYQQVEPLLQTALRASSEQRLVER